MRKTLMIASAAAAAAVLAAPAAFAQDTGLYGSLGAATFDGDGAVQARLGTRLNTWFGVEGEVSAGVEDEGVDNQFGLFGVASAPVGENFELFARAGWARLDGNRGEGDGFAYGAGAQWNLGSSGSDAIRGDYTRYETGDDTADGFSISYVRKF